MNNEKIFEYLKNEHGVILIESDVQEIRNIILESDSVEIEFDNSSLEQWISVKDRFPEHGQKTITYTPESNTTIEEVRIIRYGIQLSGFPSGVTHWMPLPEPPQ